MSFFFIFNYLRKTGTNMLEWYIHFFGGDRLTPGTQMIRTDNARWNTHFPKTDQRHSLKGKFLKEDYLWGGGTSIGLDGMQLLASFSSLISNCLKDGTRLLFTLFFLKWDVQHLRPIHADIVTMGCRAGPSPGETWPPQIPGSSISSVLFVINGSLSLVCCEKEINLI